MAWGLLGFFGGLGLLIYSWKNNPGKKSLSQTQRQQTINNISNSVFQIEGVQSEVFFSMFLFYSIIKETVLLIKCVRFLSFYVTLLCMEGGLTMLSVTSVKSDKRPFLNVKK